MVVNQLDKVNVPELPKLTNGFVVVQEPAWNTLIQYVQMQSDTINRLIDVLDKVIAKHSSDAVRITDEFSKINKELSDIAQALEGEFNDD